MLKERPVRVELVYGLGLMPLGLKGGGPGVHDLQPRQSTEEGLGQVL